MIVLRFIGILALISIGASLVVYLLTRNRRYLIIAWRVFQFALVFALVLGAFYLVERLILVV